jgi:hypothetical protein
LVVTFLLFLFALKKKTAFLPCGVLKTSVINVRRKSFYYDCKKTGYTRNINPLLQPALNLESPLTKRFTKTVSVSAPFNNAVVFATYTSSSGNQSVARVKVLRGRSYTFPEMNENQPVRTSSDKFPM